MNPALKGWRFMEVERVKDHTALAGLSPEMLPHVLSIFQRIPVVTQNAAFAFGYHRLTEPYWVGSVIELGWFNRTIETLGNVQLVLTVKRDRSGNKGFEIWRK